MRARDETSETSCVHQAVRGNAGKVSGKWTFRHPLKSRKSEEFARLHRPVEDPRSREDPHLAAHGRLRSRPWALGCRPHASRRSVPTGGTGEGQDCLNRRRWAVSSSGVPPSTPDNRKQRRSVPENPHTGVRTSARRRPSGASFYSLMRCDPPYTNRWSLRRCAHGWCQGTSVHGMAGQRCVGASTGPAPGHAFGRSARSVTALRVPGRRPTRSLSGRHCEDGTRSRDTTPWGTVRMRDFLATHEGAP